MPARIAVLCIAACLAACGFHLRGSGGTTPDIGAERIHVIQAGAGRVAAEVRSQLQLAGARLTASPPDAEYVLRLYGERMERDVLSVSPDTGKVEEYQLTLSVLMTVTGEDGETLLEERRIALSRDFTFDQDAVLGKFSEEELLREELTREAADQVLRRLGALIAGRRAAG